MFAETFRLLPEVDQTATWQPAAADLALPAAGPLRSLLDDPEKGGLVAAALNVTDNTDIWLGLSFIDPTVKDIEVADNTFRDVEPTFTPEVQFSGVGRYTIPNTILGGNVSLQLDGSYASSSFSNINNFDSHIMPKNWIGNARIQWNSVDGRWSVAGFVKNFSDSRAQTSTFDLATIGGADEISFERPRWGGVNVRYNFGGL